MKRDWFDTMLWAGVVIMVWVVVALFAGFALMIFAQARQMIAY